jgi:hypothetical protein
MLKIGLLRAMTIEVKWPIDPGFYRIENQSNQNDSPSSLDASTSNRVPQVAFQYA